MAEFLYGHNSQKMVYYVTINQRIFILCTMYQFSQWDMTRVQIKNFQKFPCFGYLARLVIAWKCLVNDNLVSKVMPGNLAEVTERMALPCSVMCQSGSYRDERWNKSFEVLPAFSPILHWLAYTARSSIDCCSFVVMIEKLGLATKYFRSSAKIERKTLEVGGRPCVKMR